MPTGRFIVISGPEGSGKTTVVGRLRLDFPDFVYTREPGGTAVGNAIRAILLDHPDHPPVPEAELLLFFADRCQHVAEVVRPNVAADRTVLSDRYWMDSFAYQWYARLGRESFEDFWAKFGWLNLPEPDLWILLDLNPEIGLQRRRGAGGENRLDRETPEFHRRVRTGFLLLQQTATFPSVLIDANQALERVYEDVLAALG